MSTKLLEAHVHYDVTFKLLKTSLPDKHAISALQSIQKQRVITKNGSSEHLFAHNIHFIVKLRFKYLNLTTGTPIEQKLLLTKDRWTDWGTGWKQSCTSRGIKTRGTFTGFGKERGGTMSPNIE